MSLNKLLAMAVTCENVAEVKELLIRKADVNYRVSGTRSTPLLLAVMHRNLELVTILIEANANVDITNNDGFTPLVTAVRNGDLDIVKKLSEAHDFGPYILSTIGNVVHRCSMPLHVAVETKNLEMTRFLLSKGALLTDMDATKNTPLHSAVKRRHFDILKELVKHKRTINDLNVLNGRGETPLQLAVALRLQSKFYGCLDCYPLDVLRILILQGAKVTGVNRARYNSPLSAALNFYEKDPACTQALIKYGMFVYATTSSWQTIRNFNEYSLNPEVGQRALIKFCTLKYADELILEIIETYHKSSFYAELEVFINKCETEIENMKKCAANQHYSLYEVLLQCLIHKRDDFFSVVKNSQEIVHNVLDALCCSRFPIYCDVIASVFCEKSHLEAKLMNYYVFTWKLNSTKVKLNQECLMEILKYLSVADLVNFTVAYFEFHEHLSKTMINNISSITIHC